MPERRTARRYAQALFQLAREAGRVEALREDFRMLSALLQASEDLDRFIRHPIIPAAHRRAILAELFEARLEPASFRFLLLLEEKRRLNLLADIGRVIHDLYYEFKRVRRVVVTSAHPLSEPHRAQLQDRLRARFDRDIEATYQLNPSLLGGFQVRVGDEIYDASISTQLTRVRELLIHS